MRVTYGCPADLLRPKSKNCTGRVRNIYSYKIFANRFITRACHSVNIDKIPYFNYLLLPPR